MFDEKNSCREGWYRPGPEKQGNLDAAEPLGSLSPDIESSPQSAGAGTYTHTPPPRAAGAVPRRKNAAVVKAVSLTVCILILIVASAYIFMDRGDSGELKLPTIELNPFNWGDAQPELPESGTETEPGDRYDNYFDYFENYYTGLTGVSGIPKIKAESGVKLRVSSERGDELSLQEVYALCNPAVVGVTTYVNGEEYGWGSGFIFDKRGYLATNFHVIEGADTATVTLYDDAVYDASLIGYDVATDIAVLKIDAEGLTAARIGSSDVLSVGDDVVAIGNPLGDTYRGTMTNGIISAINRDIVSSGHTQTLLQTNAALNEGNSGGPLINMYGQVIGITNMKMVSYTGVSIEGIGFAIPSSTLEIVINELLSSGYVAGRPALGVSVGSIPGEASSYYDLPYGLYVTSVENNSGAYKAGIRQGDIITEVNGEPCTSTDDIVAVKDALKVGDFIELTVWRNGETFDADVELMDANDFTD